MSNGNRVLIVDDDEKILRILKLQLQHNQFEVFTATNGNDALDIFMTEQNIPLILLDIMLPGIDGIALCKKFKNVNPAVKVIIVSAKDQSKDVVQGLNSGADDYIRKPFIFDELLARIHANLRKNGYGELSDNILSFEDLTINLNTFEVDRGGHHMELSKTEFDLLEYLVVNHDLVQSREQILNRVWGYNYYGNYNIVDVYIKYLRDKVDKDFERKLIQTVRGRGYVIK
ncbi:MAG: response regulator transcription factor [Anaerofustis sp.]